MLAKSKAVIKVSAEEKKRAAGLSKLGIKPLDALHLALAEVGYSNYTQGREALFANKSLDEIVSEIEKRRKTAQ